jgi:hypothetical protein
MVFGLWKNLRVRLDGCASANVELLLFGVNSLREVL